MLSLDCSVDYDNDFWTGFSQEMESEWAVDTGAGCHEIEEFPSRITQYVELRDRYLDMHGPDIQSTASDSPVTNFTAYIDSLLSGNVKSSSSQQDQVVFLTKFSQNVFRNEFADGIAYVKHDLALVRNNYHYSTGTISHEMLHLVLEEQGKSRACFHDAVHDHQYDYKINLPSYSIINKFECDQWAGLVRFD